MLKKRSLVLGFDVSSVRTGFSMVRSGRFYSSSGNYGTIEPPKGCTLSEKLVFFRDRVIRVFSELLDPPTLVAVEDVFVGQMSSAIILARFSGVLLETIKEVSGCEPVLLTATHARKVLGLPNNKEAVFEAIRKKYKLAEWAFKTHNDITDSLVVALAAGKEYKTRE